MYVLHVERRPVVGVAAQRQPENPVVDVGIEPCRLAVQRIYPFLPYGKRYPAVVREPRFGYEVGVPARLEIEVVERGITVVARYGGFCPDRPAFRDQVVRIERRDERRPLRTVHLFAQRDGQPQPFGGHPFGRDAGRKLRARVVVSDGLSVHVLRDDPAVVVRDEMLVQVGLCREEPFAAYVVLPFARDEERVVPVPGGGHVLQFPVAHVVGVVVGEPAVDVSGLGRDFPVPAQVIPRQHAAQRAFALFVDEFLRIAVIGRHAPQPALRGDQPGVQAEPVSVARVVIGLLQQVEVAESSVVVLFAGIVRTDDVVLVVVDVFLLVVVPVGIFVRGRRIYHARGGLPAVVAVGETQEFVRRPE